MNVSFVYVLRSLSAFFLVLSQTIYTSMKKLLPFLVLCYQFATAQSPITFNMSNTPVAGQTQRVAIDTFPLPTVNFGNKGANQVYDFSNLTLYKYDTVEYRVPTNSQKTTCPNADVATTLDGISFLLTNTDTPGNKLTLEGFEGQLCPGQTVSAAYSTKPDVYQFPTNYLSTFSGTGYLQKTVSASQVCQSFPVTQVRLTINTTYTDTIDGWGKVITPVGAYKCLRKQRKETTTTLIEAQAFGFWNTVSNTTSTTIRYTYLTKEGKGSIINFNYDTANVLQSVQWSMTPPTAPVADFTFAYGTNGAVNFTDASDNYPTSWAWTFGDGGTSTAQNPTHTYTTNGTYTVCLIATNAGGSSTQVCKQVTVTNAPVIPVANFSWVNPNGGLVNFTDLSTNTPTGWAWTFGDGGTSTAQNPTHVYAANNTYNVCLVASNTAGNSPQVCKSVVVTGVSAVNNAPVAVNDTLSITGGSQQILHVAGNDLDPDGDNLCINAVWGSPYATEYIGGTCDMILYAPDSSFYGPDTCYYRVCDDGSPVLCDTGMVVFTVNVLNYPPVAVNDSFSVTQAVGIVVAVGANDTDPNNDALCVTAVWNSNSVMLNAGGPCNDIYYISDTCFTGLQTFNYSVCDQDGLCDTGTVKVNVLPNPDFDVVADFNWTDTSAFTHCFFLSFTNLSQNYSNSYWVIDEGTTPDTVISNNLGYPDPSLPHFFGTVCLYVSNVCKSASHCETYSLVCEGINETQLSNISLYPNPSNNVLTIDMQNNQDDITRNYAAIEVYNSIGEKVLAVNRQGENKVVNLNVAGLPNGMYAATITGANNERRTLGRFTVAH